MSAKKPHCKVCLARGVNLGPDGRCLGCRMALLAASRGIHYGQLMGWVYEAGFRAEDLNTSFLPPVENRRHRR